MKTLVSVLFGLCLATVALAESVTEVENPKRSPEELDKLLAPIALYPDSLVALILPASTISADIVLAARYLANNGPADQIEKQSWDDSVKGLARYPELVDWMDENLEWTRELGAAFVAQPTDVMNAVQRLRTKARAAGLLKDTPQHRVVVRENRILILPAEENVIYIPTYDPRVLYVREYYSYPSTLSFSMGFAVGSWLSYDCDWNRHRVWHYHRPPPSWVYRPDWRHHRHYDRDCVEWRPNPHYWNHARVSRRFGDRSVPVVVAPRFHENRSDRNWSHYHRGERRDSSSPLVRREGSSGNYSNYRGRYDRSNRESRPERTDNGSSSRDANRREHRRSSATAPTVATPESTTPDVQTAPSSNVVRSRIPYRVPTERRVENQNIVSDRRERHENRSYTPPPAPSSPPPARETTRFTRPETRSFTPQREMTRHSAPPPAAPPPPPPPAPSNHSNFSGGGGSSAPASSSPPPASEPAYERSGRFGGGTLR